MFPDPEKGSCQKKPGSLFFMSHFFMSYKWDALRDLVPFVQFKKHEKHPWMSVTVSSNTPTRVSLCYVFEIVQLVPNWARHHKCYKGSFQRCEKKLNQVSSSRTDWKWINRLRTDPKLENAKNNAILYKKLLIILAKKLILYVWQIRIW